MSALLVGIDAIHVLLDGFEQTGSIGRRANHHFESIERLHGEEDIRYIADYTNNQKMLIVAGSN